MRNRYRARDSDQRRRRGNDRPRNFGSARSDYGDRSYRGMLNRRGDDRDWWDKASDELSSWFGDEDANRRRRMDARGGRGGRYTYDSQRRDWRDIPVSEIMTSEVAMARRDDPLAYAADLMARYDCGSIPVVERTGRMVGMLTDRDLALRAFTRSGDPNRMDVGDCMTDEAFTCYVDDTLESCMRTMSNHQVRRVAIVDENDRVVGIVSQGDIALHSSDHAGQGERRAVAETISTISEEYDRPYA